jgi:hypothetical protein
MLALRVKSWIQNLKKGGWILLELLKRLLELHEDMIAEVAVLVFAIALLT